MCIDKTKKVRYTVNRQVYRTFLMRLTGLEPVPIAGHAPQACAYADSATTAHINLTIIG